MARTLTRPRTRTLLETEEEKEEIERLQMEAEDSSGPSRQYGVTHEPASLTGGSGILFGEGAGSSSTGAGSAGAIVSAKSGGERFVEPCGRTVQLSTYN